jgi:hypothetical protein
MVARAQLACSARVDVLSRTNQGVASSHASDGLGKANLPPFLEALPLLLQVFHFLTKQVTVFTFTHVCKHWLAGADSVQ